ncbi:MAG: alanine--glyoxylate aminotransferase family protein [Planctomycetaceae bacterium]|nr:alanine--glyoxylate aminotransferase family protein [Planctomycetaceae bacterium]
MRKYRLLTPGPTQIPEQSLLALAKQVTHHRTDEASALYRSVISGLQQVFCTKNDIYLLTGSGTAAMEAAVTNFATRGEKILVLSSGKFSERWADVARAFGMEPILYELPWGKRFHPAEVKRLLNANDDIVAVYGTLCETSTGVGHDIEGIGCVVRETNALFVVDGISATGAVECRCDDWGIDVLVVGSQKALMGLPGTAMIAVSEKAWKKCDKTEKQAFYFDFVKYKKNDADSTTPFTTPKSQLEVLDLNLKLLLEEGITTVWTRTAKLAAATRAGFTAMGLQLTTAFPSDAMTAAFIPESIDAKAFMKTLENRFGIKFAGGQGDWKGKIFRMAHFGLIDECDVLGILCAVELTLNSLGFAVPFGTAASAAEMVFSTNDADCRRW